MQNQVQKMYTTAAKLAVEQETRAQMWAVIELLKMALEAVGDAVISSCAIQCMCDEAKEGTDWADVCASWEAGEFEDEI